MTHFVGVQTDVTDKKRIEDQLRHKATYDELTGLLTRDEFMSRLEEEFERARRYEHGGSVVLLDLDHFKESNDTYGHLLGDEVLEEIGTILEETKRENDLCGCYGGEEFCLFLPETAQEEATVLAERILEKLREPTFPEGDEQFSVTASVGVSSLRDADESLTTLLKRAHEALYHAKENGRDQVVSRQELNGSF